MKKAGSLFIGETGETPIGSFRLAASAIGLVAVEWGKNETEFREYLTKRFGGEIEVHPERIREAGSQLQEYLYGRRQVFNLAIDWSVLRPFQLAVLKATYAIPYGRTCTYKEIATRLGRPHAARAVGRAEATNPMPLVLPCHRVIGMDGKLHGYGMAEGLITKAWLLKMEGAMFA